MNSHPTSLDSTILALYDNENLSIEEVADQVNCEPLAVKALLMQRSDRYKMEMAAKRGQATLSSDVSDQEYAQLLTMYKGIAYDTDVDANTRMRIIRDLMDEYKGRKDVKITQGDKPTLTVNLVNSALSAIEMARNRTLALSARRLQESGDNETETINVETVKAA
jgi:hypothetical protein